jgi:hypothetical protein
MYKLLILLFVSLSPQIALAGKPFAQGDANIGKAMVEKNCISCHAAKYGADGSAIYTREDRKVNSSSQLLTQIRNCNTMLGLKWFEDEELHVANYLNQTYYKFDN